VLLTLPVTILTLGLFIFIINGLLFWFVGSIDLGFKVDDFWTGVFGYVVFSVISWLLSAVILGAGTDELRDAPHRLYSFEFFPPRTPEGADKLRAARRQLAQLRPRSAR
jgi:hypothetical protein